jgi:hypothetical protein
MGINIAKMDTEDAKADILALSLLPSAKKPSKDDQVRLRLTFHKSKVNPQISKCKNILHISKVLVKFLHSSYMEEITKAYISCKQIFNPFLYILKFETLSATKNIIPSF